MEFRLIYQGSLPSGSNDKPRAKEKHQIRKTFHKQLYELWRQDSHLREWICPTLSPGQSLPQRPHIEVLADEYARCGYRFVPLATKANGRACSLDILFLRRDQPGNLVKSGGDLDNRLKVLLDGLRMPEHLSEIGGYLPDPDENPFYCLLENDDLITHLSVTTDQLLIPKREEERIHDVALVILVKIKIVDRTKASIQMGDIRAS